MNDQPDENQHAVPMIAGESMDNRMRRLENAIVALQDTRLMEERLLERVQQNSTSAAGDSQTNALVDAGGAARHDPRRRSQFNLPADAPALTHFSASTWPPTDMIQRFARSS